LSMSSSDSAHAKNEWRTEMMFERVAARVESFVLGGSPPPSSQGSCGRAGSLFAPRTQTVVLRVIGQRACRGYGGRSRWSGGVASRSSSRQSRNASIARSILKARLLACGLLLASTSSTRRRAAVSS
jgi:hypothetical protein